jgi:protein-S-isoprenylcysteine O-methyltransferase Ste14
MTPELLSAIQRWLFPATWTAWAVYWWLSARDVKRTERREPLGSRLLHLGPMVLAALLLASPGYGVPGLSARVVPWAPWAYWLGFAVTCAGLAFAVWARRHIGRNWSAIVTLKQDHELVTTGPYALVRHPIYTGLLLGFLGWAIAVDRWRGVLAVAIVFVALLRKYRLEERWMHERFGATYDAYRARVKALVPFLF